MKSFSFLIALILTFTTTSNAQVENAKSISLKKEVISSYLVKSQNNEPTKGDLQTTHINKYDSLGRLIAEFDYYTKSYHENSKLLRRIKWDTIKTEYSYGKNDSISKMKVEFIGQLKDTVVRDTLAKFFIYDEKNNIKEIYKSKAYITMGDYFGRTYSFGPPRLYYNFYLINKYDSDSLVRSSYNQLEIKDFEVKRLFDLKNRILEQEEMTTSENNFVKRSYNEIGQLSKVTKIEKTKEGMNIVTFNKNWLYNYTNTGRLKEEKYSQKYAVGIFKIGSNSKILNFDRNTIYEYMDNERTHIISTFINDKLIKRTTKKLSENGVVLNQKSITYQGKKEVERLCINYYDSGIKKEVIEQKGKKISTEKYNEQGDLIHSISYRKDKKISEHSRKYKYNSNGDWIQIIYFDDQGLPTNIDERSIQYY